MLIILLLLLGYRIVGRLRIAGRILEIRNRNNLSKKII
jgi:hypothetical protein